MGTKKDVALLKEFKKRVSKKLPLEKMILFGSRAHGKPGRWSDFDIILVSKKFRNKDTLKRGIGLYEYWNYDYPVDFLCYTPEEFKKLKNRATLVATAVEEGVEI